MNLMTDAARRHTVLRQARRFWSRVLGGTLLALCLLGLFEWWQGSASTQRLNALESQYAPLQALKQECTAMQREISALQDVQQLTWRLIDVQPAATLLAVVAAAAAETQGDVFLEKLELEQSGTAQHPRRRRATLEGAGKSNAAIAEFATALRDSGLFEEVTLNSSNSEAGRARSTRTFRLECQF